MIDQLHGMEAVARRFSFSIEHLGFLVANNLFPMFDCVIQDRHYWTEQHVQEIEAALDSLTMPQHFRRKEIIDSCLLFSRMPAAARGASDGLL